jgi:hypothetical protein
VLRARGGLRDGGDQIDRRRFRRTDALTLPARRAQCGIDDRNVDRGTAGERERTGRRANVDARAARRRAVGKAPRRVDDREESAPDRTDRSRRRLGGARKRGRRGEERGVGRSRIEPGRWRSLSRFPPPTEEELTPREPSRLFASRENPRDCSPKPRAGKSHGGSGRSPGSDGGGRCIAGKPPANRRSKMPIREIFPVLPMRA